MSNGSTYTYRNGKRIELKKRPDQFVVRALPDELEDHNISPDAVPISSSSSRVFTRPVDLETDMSLSRHIAPTHHAYELAETGEEFLITDRVFVTFHEPPTAEELADFAGKYALVLRDSYSDQDFLFQLTDHTGMNPVKLVVKLMEEEDSVAQADHDLNFRMSTYQLPPPTDPAYAQQWHLHTHFSHPEFDPRASSRCEEAWQILGHFGSADVVVGVTDDGCKMDHPDFDSPGKMAAWGYMRETRLVTNVDIDADPDQMYKTGANHGTSCAGVIGGEADAVLTVGAVPGCRLLPIQWQSNGPFLLISDSKMMTVLNFIADKVDVLSNSWGGRPNTLWNSLVLNKIRQLAQDGGRRGRGIVFLWAAGNENCPLDHIGTIDIPYTNGWEFPPLGSPIWVGVETSRVFRNNLLNIPGVAHVAALASNAQRSHYSNYGTGIAFCAPTNNVHDYRRLSVNGLGITTTTGNFGDVTESFGGTSSATPLVAGIMALVISANPDLTAEEVISVLKQTASKDLNMASYPRTPPASFDLDTSWDVSPIAPFNDGAFQDIGEANGTWSPWFGHGKVDALAAVTEALRLATPPPSGSVQETSSPALTIPDNDPTGVSDTITINDDLFLSDIRVAVNIRHTYIGDLQITLHAPGGTAVVLHNRRGGSANNIDQVYDMTAVPALTSLINRPVQGDWTLRVRDLAARDEGQLREWSLAINGRPDTVLVLEETEATRIPDNNPAGIVRSLQTNENGTVREASVSVNITHSFIGDLVVGLTSPVGTNVPLHVRSGGSSDNLITTFTAAAVPELQRLRGEPVSGAWQLSVADVAARDVGKLGGWSVRILRE